MARHISCGSPPLTDLSINVFLIFVFFAFLFHAEALRSTVITRFPATMASSDSSLRFRYNEVSRVPLLNFPDTRSSYAPPRFDHPSRFDGLLLASWCLNTGHAEISIITRLYEGDSLALSLIRSSGETRVHRSPFARPAILTVRRLLYSNGFLPPFSSAEFCSAYQSLLIE